MATISDGTTHNLASEHKQVIDGHRTPVGYEQIPDTSVSPNTVLTAAQGLTVPAGAKVAIIQAVTQNVRWRDDGTSPTTSAGMQLVAGESFLYTGDLSAIEFIEETASAELNVSYYK